MKNERKNNRAKKSKSVRRKLPGLHKLLTNESLNKLSEPAEPTILREGSSLLPSFLGDGEVNALFPVDTFLSHGDERAIHARITRVNPEKSQENACDARNTLATRAVLAHSANTDMADQNAQHGSSKKKYRKLPKQSLTVDPELAELAKKYFRITRHGSLTGFVENKLKAEFQKDAARIRATGMKVPEWILKKP